MTTLFGSRWRGEESLKESGQSWAYKVSDETAEFHGSYVLKRLKNPARLGRFANEITALKELRHPNITRLVDFNLEEAHPWFVQEYCAGGDLEDYIKHRGPMLPSTALSFLIEVANGLSYAHKQNKIHRDIKPANIYLRTENGPAVLGDFGLCWEENHGKRLTSTDEAVGSFRFMAPEVRDGRMEIPSWRIDIYSLGKLFYSMLSGGTIFDRENHREDRWNLVHLRNDLTMEHINNLLDQMITFDPNMRIDSDTVKMKAEQCVRLVVNEFSPLSGDIRSACKYCGIGNYKPIVYSDEDFQNFLGLQPTAISDVQRNFRLMACDRCGNIQFFAMSILPKDNKWFPPNPQ